MKSRYILVLCAVSGILLTLSSYRLILPEAHITDVDIPENVKAVLDSKCYGCHNMEAKADKAKEKLLLDKLNDLSKAKLISALSEIEEVVEEGKMPPEKFLEKYPDKELSSDEGMLIKEWASGTADALLN